MKAYRITSTEYHANQPRVFLFVNGEYYGCLVYPKHHKFPQDVDYWRSATCADDGRYFHVEDMEVSEGVIASIKHMQTSMKSLAEKLKPYTGYRPFATKKERELDYQSDLKTEEYNRPIDREIFHLNQEIHNLIVDLKQFKV